MGDSIRSSGTSRPILTSFRNEASNTSMGKIDNMPALGNNWKIEMDARIYADQVNTYALQIGNTSSEQLALINGFANRGLEYYRLGNVSAQNQRIQFSGPDRSRRMVIGFESSSTDKPERNIYRGTTILVNHEVARSSGVIQNMDYAAGTTMYIGAGPNPSTGVPAQYCRMRMYELKVWKDDVLLIHINCKTNSLLNQVNAGASHNLQLVGASALYPVPTL